MPYKPMTAALLAAALPLAGALAADGWEPVERIREIAAGAARATLPATARLSAAPLDERLRLPACGQPPRALPAPGAPGGNLNIPVHCDGPVAWTVHVSVRVADIRPVLVLARSAGRGEALSAAMLSLQERDIATLPLGFLSDPGAAIGKQLKRPLAAGSPVTPDLLESPRLVRRGELVTLLGRSGGIEVRAQGKALSDGSSGERIRVENTGSRRVIQGVVAGSGLVEVAL